MLGVNVPFRLPGAVLLAALALLAFTHTGAVRAAEPTQANSFLKLTPEHRYWWVNGAVLTTSHLVAVRDKAKGDCIAKWYLDDRAAKQKLIEATIAKYPNEGETTVVLGLLTQACGELLSAANR
ncbi:MAG TPA: hypothetical protein VGE08_04010 [Steroidobacter sp.]|uniref:hypothetical protein n=1 Tax=Steroidobacter sp. TaxID=1978227 RepID=UPI002ED98CD1